MAVIPAHHSCKHCGLDSEESDFCCFGCRTAYEIIQASRLGDFYKKNEPSKKPVDSIASESLEALDQDDFLQSQCRRVNGEWVGRFAIEGLHCSACIWLLENLPAMEANCLNARVNFGAGEIELRFKDHLSLIAHKINQLGYCLRPTDHEDLRSSLKTRELLRLGVAGALAAALMHIGLLFLAAWNNPMSHGDAKALGFISAALMIPIFFYAAQPFFISSLRFLKIGRLHRDILVVAAIAFGFSFSLAQTIRGGIDVYYDSIAMLVFLLLAGRYLIGFQHKKLRQSLDQKVQRYNFSKQAFEWVMGRSLKVGDRLLIRKNETLACDAKLLSAESWLETSVVTGESVPRRYLKDAELPVLAENLGGDIEAVCTKTWSESWIMKSAGEFQTKEVETPSRWMDLFVVLVVLIAISAWFWGGQDWISKSMAILIAACPCALGLSRPLVLASFWRQALNHHYLIKNLDRCLNWRNLRGIAFDKTGTLSEANLQLGESKFEGEAKLTDYANIIYGMASTSAHPVSRAIAFHIYDNCKFDPLDLHVVDQAGNGLTCEYLGDSYFLGRNGNRGLKNLDLMSCQFFKNDRCLGSFYFEDRAECTALQALEQLRAQGQALSLLSGDHFESVKSFEKELGFEFDHVLADQKPGDKINYILSQPNCAFVGDGLNDVGALKVAYASMGFQTSREANFESADIYLIRKDLRMVPNFIEGARRAYSRIKINYGISLLYNVASIVLIASGLAGPVICAIFMPLSSLSVGLMSRYWKAFAGTTKPAA
ncbi:MAG: hypothetical protein COV44_00725 [Deltaproteobacteria bacterium CG11_big_fil_rev_8_21_14_0_20_45_16]|nr:MAG: hypothetical protein COV44_00725 [Deltaproteobacteria bacterium CG11_big_fil_rev_8_21_14_0_20_45_16]